MCYISNTILCFSLLYGGGTLLALMGVGTAFSALFRIIAAHRKQE